MGLLSYQFNNLNDLLIHDLKERELALIGAVEKKYGDRITEWIALTCWRRGGR